MTHPGGAPRSVSTAQGFDGAQRRGAVSEGEYARRLQGIDSPLYTHVGGMASAETRPGTAPLVQSDGPR